MPGAGLAVEFLAAQLDRQVQRRRPRREADRVLAADCFRRDALDFVDVRADGGHPVGADGFVHPLLLFAVHGGRGEPEFGRERRQAVKPGVLEEVGGRIGKHWFFHFVSIVPTAPRKRKGKHGRNGIRTTYRGGHAFRASRMAGPASKRWTADAASRCAFHGEGRASARPRTGKNPHGRMQETERRTTASCHGVARKRAPSPGVTGPLPPAGKRAIFRWGSGCGRPTWGSIPGKGRRPGCRRHRRPRTP